MLRISTLTALLALGAQGCSRAEHILVREGMDRTTLPIRDEHKAWALEKVQAGTMSQASYDNRLKAHEEYENLVNEDRSRDAK